MRFRSKILNILSICPKNNLRLLIGLLRCFACSKTTRIKPEDCLRYNNIPESFWKWWNSDDAWSPHAIATSGAWVHVPSLMEGQDLVDLEQFLIFFLFMLAMEIITTYKSIKNPQTIYFISFFFSIVFYPLPIGLTFFFLYCFSLLSITTIIYGWVRMLLWSSVRWMLSVAGLTTTSGDKGSIEMGFFFLMMIVVDEERDNGEGIGLFVVKRRR